MNTFTKILFGLALVLILYGCLCRLLSVYFFWESVYLGWFFLVFGLIGFLIYKIKENQHEQKFTNVKAARVAIGFLVFVLLVQALLFINLLFSDAYKVTKSYLINNTALKEEIGVIQGFVIAPVGGIQKARDSSGEYGSATISLIVKGERKIIELMIVVEKEPQGEWEVVDIE
ncbi:hypothetical protein [Xanthocytophaga agilis]|uniref:Uncharacterized protein n=1 Tax=Xanthocytophaga agilis TaxID=3048010 RepID=A0AAE3QYY6_9BACT|nr:hypothetical protein [Xanthocytophaga agilis]MDJ1500045.1 hypothetical protein [Xanthocytophaga agilis]